MPEPQPWAELRPAGSHGFRTGRGGRAAQLCDPRVLSRCRPALGQRRQGSVVALRRNGTAKRQGHLQRRRCRSARGRRPQRVRQGRGGCGVHALDGVGGAAEPEELRSFRRGSRSPDADGVAASGWSIQGEPHPDGPPDLMALYMASVDECSHRSGPRQQETYMAWFDHRLARFVSVLRAADPDVFANTIFAFVADHGHRAITSALDAGPVLGQRAAGPRGTDAHPLRQGRDGAHPHIAQANHLSLSSCTPTSFESRCSPGPRP